MPAPNPVNIHFNSVAVFADGTSAAPIWAVHNTSTTDSYALIFMNANFYFSGTTTLTQTKYRLVRFAGATPLAGGTAITGVSSDSGVPVPAALVAKFCVASVLTITGITLETAYLGTFAGRRNAALPTDFTRGEEFIIILKPGEGIGWLPDGVIAAGENLTVNARFRRLFISA